MPHAEPTSRISPVLIVVAAVGVIAVVAAVAVPAILRARLAGSEGGPWQSLRSLATAQEQFKQAAHADQDGDQVGEFGWLSELAGTRPVRGSGARLNTSPFIVAILGVTDGNGISQKSGYHFVMYLQAADGSWVREPPFDAKSPAAAPVDPKAADHQEVAWRCYAWPVARGQSGNRAYVVSASGDIYSTPNTAAGQQYSGTVRVPAADAFERDGGQWRPFGN